MKLGDVVDCDSVYVKIQNILFIELLVFKYVYISFGVNVVIINCLNYIFVKIMIEVVIMVNICFDFYGIFDCQYLILINLLKVFFVYDFYILN